MRQGDRRATTRGVAIRLPGVVLLGACIWLLVALLTDSRYQVRDLAISGAREIGNEEIAALFDVKGQSIFLVKTEALSRAVQERYGCIESISVRCRLPDKVSVTVHEKDIALVWSSGGKYWWLGSQGEVLGEATDPGQVVVVVDRSGAMADPGSHVPGVPVALVRGLSQALPACREYDYMPQEGLVVYVTAERWPVFLGRKGDASTKAAILTALVDELMARRESVEYIDLRDEDHPTYKPV